MEWKKLSVTLSELCLASVLRCGQSFRWKFSEPDEWSCVLRGRILVLRQDPTFLYYRTIFPTSSPAVKESDSPDDTDELIRDYFNLSVGLTELYEKWSSRDPHFKKVAPQFTGIRMLRQDPWENLVSFICSSNNNIIRISQMVENLCVNFGSKIGHYKDLAYYDFPAPSALTHSGVEGKLRDLSFGYRAKYIQQTARMVVNDHPVGWLEGLRNVGYGEAHEALLQLQGVGPKVADCVCLMSLDKTEAVPVDTHVWKIAMRDYKFGKGKHKSLTKATYTAIGDHFRGLWGNEAGWAHSVLFTAELKAFASKEVKVEEVYTISTAKRDGEENKPEVKSEAVEYGAKIKTEKREGKVKVRINQKVNNAKRVTRVKVKVEIKSEDQDQENLGACAGVGEAATEKTAVEEELKLKRGVGVEDEEADIKFENTGMTMADRIKRRRRQ